MIVLYTVFATNVENPGDSNVVRKETCQYHPRKKAEDDRTVISDYKLSVLKVMQ